MRTSTTTAAASIAPIDSFVTAAVDGCAGHTNYDSKDLEHVARRLAMWCADEGIPLEYAQVFSEKTITLFIRDGLVAQRLLDSGMANFSDASRANKRAQLRRMAEILLMPGVEKERFKASDPRAPYSAAEIEELREWATRQPAARVDDARLILALGLGAGLSAGEIGDLRFSDIAVDQHGVLITVAAGRSRTVPVRREWESVIVELTDAGDPDRFVVLPNRAPTVKKNLIPNFVDGCARASIRVNSQRLRASWLVAHLGGPLPIKALAEAAGLESLEGLSRYLAFVPAASAPDARLLLRG